MKISAIILTKNEEKNIERAIKSVAFCEEIIIVDDLSTDNTVDKIQNLEISTKGRSTSGRKSEFQILKHELKGDFAAQRNWAMGRAKNEWVLFLDADEIISPELKSEIESSVVSRQSSVCAYYIKRRDFWWGRELKFGETLKARNQGIMRLIKKESGKWQGAVHEEFITDLPIGQLDGFLNHYPHPTLKEFIHDINYYSSARARELQTQGKKGSILPVLLYPPAKFFLTYFIYLGFLDGPAGFAYAFLMSFHSFLVRAKLFQYTRIDIS